MARLKFFRTPPQDGPCELHIEQNLARAGVLGTTKDLHWHWWISGLDGRIAHSGYRFTVKLADQVGRKLAAKHSNQIK
ncbi:hypothetical protein [Streptomyces sp. TLI_146]|uniref:hypothetical protein n=1 Tax=Streptomyces sp. TLI_146 TaxID=1938858 RepID=UPI000CC40093|nr:hypothetical protein [Streptomyces sp. TLI_146]PKV84261.1 hypothetical protein BX283_1774 [Streptomyces sp. TLI_146]